MMAKKGKEAASSAGSVSVSEFKANLNACLKSIKSSGSFAVFGNWAGAPNPRIYLKKGDRSISVPLSDADARKIAAVSKGEKTLVDTRPWEVLSSDFELRNSTWERHVEHLLTAVCTDLGVQRSVSADADIRSFYDVSPGVQAAGKKVTAELRKMSLYDRGSMFQPHQDSEKVHGTFGTLVIVLPSKFSGGEIVVNHAGRAKMLANSKHSEVQTSYLAWFSDATIESKAVLEGRRLVLVYDLVSTTPGSTIQTTEVDTSAESQTQAAQLSCFLQTWKDNAQKENFPKTLGYLLEHDYAIKKASYQNLEAHDRHATWHLRTACEQHGFSIYLADCQQTRLGHCDNAEGANAIPAFHPMTEEIERRTVLSTVCDLDGTTVGRKLDFHEGSFLQRDPFSDVDPDEEQFVGSSQNDVSTHIFRRRIAIIMPKAHRIEFFITPYLDTKSSSFSEYKRGIYKPPQVDTWIDCLSKELSTSPGDLHVISGLKQICTLVISRSQAQLRSPASCWPGQDGPFFSSDIKAKILPICVDIDSKEMFLDGYDTCPKGYFYFQPPAVRSIGVALLRFKLDSILPRLTSDLSKITSLSGRFDNIKEIDAGLSTEARRLGVQTDGVYRNWMRKEMDSAIYSSATYMQSAADGYALASYCKSLARVAPEEILTKFLPIVRRGLEYILMMMAFLSAIVDAAMTGELPQDISEATFLAVIPGIPCEFRLFRIYSLASVAQTIDNISTVLCRCHQLKLPGELLAIVLKIVSESKEAWLHVFNVLYLPLLKKLVASFPQQRISVQDSPFQLLFQEVLRIYIRRYVKKEPQQPVDWKRSSKAMSCRCRDCKKLINFLESPTQQVCRFAMNESRRNHLSARVDMTSCYQDIDRKGNPHALIAIKDRSEYEASHDSWKQRRDIAMNCINDLGPKGDLKVLLEDQYEAIMGARVVKAKQEVQDALLNPPSPGNGFRNGRETNLGETSEIRPFAGKKRKASPASYSCKSHLDDFSDLSEDSED